MSAQSVQSCTMRTDANTAPPRVAIKTDVPPDLAAQVRRAAERDGRTVSNYLRLVLRKHLDDGADHE